LKLFISGNERCPTTWKSHNVQHASEFDRRHTLIYQLVKVCWQTWSVADSIRRPHQQKTNLQQLLEILPQLLQKAATQTTDKCRHSVTFSLWISDKIYTKLFYAFNDREKLVLEIGNKVFLHNAYLIFTSIKNWNFSGGLALWNTVWAFFFKVKEETKCMHCPHTTHVYSFEIVINVLCKSMNHSTGSIQHLLVHVLNISRRNTAVFFF